MQKTTYSCSQCGGRSVHVGRWVNPNTGEQGEDLFDHPVSFATAFWCDDCGAERALNVDRTAEGDEEPIEHKVFVALDDDDFLCEDCIPADLRARLGDPEVEVWEYYSDGWLAAPVCRCGLSLPVHLLRPETATK